VPVEIAARQSSKRVADLPVIEVRSRTLLGENTRFTIFFDCVQDGTGRGFITGETT
jgi:hypothetical protein